MLASALPARLPARLLARLPAIRLAALMLILWTQPSLSQSPALDLQGVLPGGKAVVSVSGGAPKIVQAGATLGDLKVLSVESQAIVVESDGQKSRITLGAGPLRLQSPAGTTDREPAGGRALLTADARGHFVTTGFVNGKPQTFLVDTGASIVALSTADARRLGLNLEKGRIVQANTANGQAYGTAIRLDSLKIGGIVMHNVEAWVMDNLSGPGLLGMTFLNRTSMQRDAGTMTLVKRY